ncbi:MAG: hypothetical protein RLZZ111_642 [Planctomycetota bacterium]|jgi:hypothetical protein
MSQQRRECIRILAIALLTATSVAGFAGLAMADGMWECNWCHQQYQGKSPPAFAKCPAKEMKQNHWWIKKG